MEINSRKIIPILLQEVVPEIGDAAAKGGMDLYDFLKEFFVEGFLAPRLQTSKPGDDVVKRCFQFVESLMSSADSSIRAAAVFQVIEPLFVDEQLLVASLPAMGEKALDYALEILDPDRLSTAARSALQPYL